MDIQVIGVPEFISIFGRENRYRVWILFLYGDRDGVISIIQYVDAVFVEQTVIHPFVKENGELLVGRYRLYGSVTHCWGSEGLLVSSCGPDRGDAR